MITRRAASRGAVSEPLSVVVVLLEELSEPVPEELFEEEPVEEDEPLDAEPLVDESLPARVAHLRGSRRY